MKKYFSVFITFIFLTPMAFGQNAGELGLVFKFNPSDTGAVGVHYQVTNDVAIQPSMAFSRSSRTQDFTREEDGAKWKEEVARSSNGLDILVPYYFHRIDNISVFIAPGLGYLREAIETNFDSDTFVDDNSEAVQRRFHMILNLGSQVNFGRFALYGSWGVRVFFLDRESKDYPSVNGEGLSRKWETTETGFSLDQLSIGMIFTLN